MARARVVGRRRRREGDGEPETEDGGDVGDGGFYEAPSPEDWGRARAVPLSRTGERRLQVAVMAEALRTLTRRQEGWERVVDWAAEESDENPFSFAAICDANGIDLDLARTRVFALAAQRGLNGTARSVSIAREPTRPRLSAGGNWHRKVPAEGTLHK